MDTGSYAIEDKGRGNRIMLVTAGVSLSSYISVLLAIIIESVDSINRDTPIYVIHYKKSYISEQINYEAF